MNDTNNTLTWTGQKEWERWTGSHKCPNCGSDEIEYNTQIVLTSYPPQSQLRCKGCGHYFSSGIKTDLIDHDALNKAYEEVKKSFGISDIRDPLPGEAPYIGDWPPSPQPGDWPPSLTPCDPLPSTNKTTMYGWVCPKCGKVNAPHRDFCDCSGNHNPNIVYYNGTGNNPNPAPTINISDTIDALNYGFETCNLHEKENNNGNL